jgi:protein SCO1
MITKRTKIAIFSLLLLITGFFFYKLIEIQDRLPYIDKVEDVQLESVLTDSYQFVHDDTVKVVSFIFTNCPDICPMTMVDLGKLQSELKQMDLFEDKVSIVTITLDPEYDTNEILSRYSENFGVDANGWYILRGTVSETQKVANEFQMVYQKEDNGFVTHSTNMYLVDGGNNIRAIHEMSVGGKQVDIDGILENINRLLSE